MYIAMIKKQSLAEIRGKVTTVLAKKNGLEKKRQFWKINN